MDKGNGTLINRIRLRKNTEYRGRLHLIFGIFLVIGEVKMIGFQDSDTLANLE